MIQTHSVLHQQFRSILHEDDGNYSPNSPTAIINMSMEVEILIAK